MKAIGSFYDDAGEKPEKHRSESHELGNAHGIVNPNNKLPSGHDLGIAPNVWQWLVARSDVSVGTNRKFNYLSLDEILALPEEESPTDDAGTAKDQIDHGQESNAPRGTGRVGQKYRPRLHVSEERQWKTLAGHGPDFKRLPLFEWKALVDIASMREKGILQGDLVRLSGQDKRSLPMRTQALAKKGYIIKQPILLRGCRSSKLWLARYAENAKVDSDGLNFDNIDLSKEALTKDLAPVSFSASWKRERIDYIAIAQAFNAIIKAWGVMRYSDMRVKLDVEGRVPQMRALAKTSRWFTGIGAVTFVAAKFAHSQRLYKDCIKFVREPTADEWKVFRSTPSTHIKVPSARLGKRGQASRAKFSKESNFSPHSQTKLRQASGQEHQTQPSNQEPTQLLWNPHKPIVNTVFEIIKRTGPTGSSNVAIGRQTLGHDYRKYVAALTKSLSMPNSQPPHLKCFDIESQLNRVGKTMTYQFFAKNELRGPPEGQETGDRDETLPNTASEVPGGNSLQQDLSPAERTHTFSQPVASKFAPISKNQLSRLQISRSSGGTKRKRLLDDEPMKGTGEDSQERSSKKPRTKEPTSSDQRPDSYTNETEVSPMANQQQPIDGSVVSAPLPVPPPPPPQRPIRPPGVYREPNNMLDPPGKKGRRRKSVVITFKCNALKDPSFFDNMRIRKQVGHEEVSHQAESSMSENPAQTPLQTSTSTVPEEAGEAQTEAAQTRPVPIKRGGKIMYRCEKCGNSWKNSNGLEYHLNKSRSTCNPSYVPPPPPPPPPPKPALKQKLPKVPEEQDKVRTPALQRVLDSARKPSPGILNGGGHRPLLPSKRTRPSETSTDMQDAGEPHTADSIRGSIILQDVEAYDVIGHRRRRESSHVASLNFDTVSRQHQTNQGISQTTPKQPSRNNEQKTTPARGKNTPTTNGTDVGTAITKGGLKAASSQPSTKATGPNRQSTSKKPKSSTYTVGKLRKERVSHIIHHLLDNNDGVFPGRKSLYCAVVAFWLQNHSDIEPPDWRVCENMVKTMGKAGELQQYFFGFKDFHNQFQDCCVIAKKQPGETTGIDMDKVDMVKEKMREMFPTPYIPEAFSFSEDDNEVFNALSSTYKDTHRSNGTRRQTQKSSVTENIEVLQYPAHVMNDIAAHAPSSKRDVVEDNLSDVAPPRKIQAKDSDISRSRSTPKPRKRREHWDLGYVAKYFWHQKHNPGEKWDQKHNPLQDFTTGTWSVLPQQKNELKPNVDSIVTSLRSTRENALASARERSQNQSGGSEAIPWSHSSPDGDSGDALDGTVLTSWTNVPKLTFIDRFVKPLTSTSFTPEAFDSEEDIDTSPVPTQHRSIDDNSTSALSNEENEANEANEADIMFTESESIHSMHRGCWPRLPNAFFESDSTGFTMVGAMPDAKWFHLENLPRSAEEIIKGYKGKLQFNCYADPLYGKFLREVETIEDWELSPKGIEVLSLGSIAPDYIFMSLSPDMSVTNMKTIPQVEFHQDRQFTAENLTDEIKNSPPSDEDVGLPPRPTRGRPKKGQSRPQPKRQRIAKDVRAATASQNVIQYKTRTLTAIPIQHRGRVFKPPPDDKKFKLGSEAELIAAFVVFKTLLGGVDRKADLGLILKTLPRFSHSALKRFWPKVNKERKTYIDALTTKFQSAFLEAYEAGKFPPLNYDDIESYDWHSVIIWATKLETHEKVNLPDSRRDLDQAHSIEDVANESTDWRETWFTTPASTVARVEATSGEHMCIPLSDSVENDEGIMSRARSWVRSLCITIISGARMPEQIRAKLLRLSNMNEAETNKLLKKVVDRLTSDRVAARSKGKILGQSLRLHGVFSKQLAKPPAVQKLRQATKFKAMLDETFRRGEAFFLPYAADDGTIMAVINLQANSRIYLEPIGIPSIPFGFERGNYDGRTYPKHYYHFKVKVSPTENYKYDEDLPVLKQALRMNPPRQGPDDMIPIWVDFFGNLDKLRWVSYLSMVIMAMATKGPLTAETASVLMKPFVEPFEAKLIMDWIDCLGLLQRFDSEKGASVGEWWWLVVGKLVVDVDVSEALNPQRRRG